MAEKSGTLSFNASLSLIFVFLFRYPHLLKRTLKKKSGSDKITKLSFRDTKYWSATLLHISCDFAVRYNRTVFLILYRLYKPYINRLYIILYRLYKRNITDPTAMQAIHKVIFVAKQKKKQQKTEALSHLLATQNAHPTG